MKFTSALAMASALIAGVFADVHQYGLCYYGPASSAGYHEAATKAACAAYKKRNQGTQQWNTCPDCALAGTPPACHSPAFHIGGDEMSYYCKQAGAAGSFAN
ncbi:hypothetical protein FKW77_003460 [Venturia effusa]|uniref:Uncharacterized protein n=1 Tax=Venturia effusa TaxID=50376 RepID=A0A517LDK9_9PEZI|nr:hypothetical protein FKW77_003460 [Venturia effusa]